MRIAGAMGGAVVRTCVGRVLLSKPINVALRGRGSWPGSGTDRVPTTAQSWHASARRCTFRRKDALSRSEVNAAVALAAFEDCTSTPDAFEDGIKTAKMAAPLRV